MVRIECQCGRVLTAPDDAIGKFGKCSGCGSRVLIHGLEDELVLPEATPGFALGFSANLGIVRATHSTLEFTFHVEHDGVAYVQIVAMNEYEKPPHKRQVVLMRLDDKHVDDLVAAVKTVKETVDKYRNARPGRHLTEVFRKR